MRPGPTPQPHLLTDDEREELRAVYLQRPALHRRLSFAEAIANTAIRICLWNVAQCRARRQRVQAAANEPFALT